MKGSDTKEKFKMNAVTQEIVNWSSGNSGMTSPCILLYKVDEKLLFRSKKNDSVIMTFATRTKGVKNLS